MADGDTKLIIDIRPTIHDALREVLISDIGSLWDDYCYENSVPPEIKIHGIGFLEDFAGKLEKINTEEDDLP